MIKEILRKRGPLTSQALIDLTISMDREAFMREMVEGWRSGEIIPLARIDVGPGRKNLLWGLPEHDRS